MARETIRRIEARHRAELRRLSEDLRAAEDGNARLIVEKCDLVRRQMEALDLKDDRIGELIRGHAAALAAKDARISELFRSNNAYQEEARAARAEVQQLQRALSDASRVIATLGQRAVP
ncbi:hypothetical protein X566_20015 [Afipia sp. P52-10]|uniref:hypothetical protein n=1 Tax=Afipia sp. P52-10 TaxID=1429916 RepID=UPI0003DF3972|nr:hypothetical protein [Afipia sp. P52-10]ETR75900.1 hypothetical protein X566_20015 [Afipia sp. P52-10]